jgi:hypothetical protein
VEEPWWGEMPERRQALWRARSWDHTSEVPTALLAPGTGFSFGTVFGTALAIVRKRSGSSSLTMPGMVDPELPFPVALLLFATTEPSSESVAGAAPAVARSLPREPRPCDTGTFMRTGGWSVVAGESERRGAGAEEGRSAAGMGGVGAEIVRASRKICWMGMLGLAPLRANCKHPTLVRYPLLHRQRLLCLMD